MIYMRELLRGVPSDSLSIEARINLGQLLYRLNFIRRAFHTPMVVTSGYRTLEHHEDVYREMNEKRIAQGINPVPIPLSSLHLIGAAADVLDKNHLLRDWIGKNLNTLEMLCLYCEDFNHTDGWVHFQIYPPSSGQRFFIP